MTTLLLALRHDDHRVARELLDDRDLDVNRESLLESATAAPHEQPTYPTTALVEACRCGDERILRLLLARDDLNVNQLTTKLKCTALADACARGDAASVHILLDDPRTDATLGDTVVAHPALYACMNGSVGVMEALSSRGILTDALEDSLLATAVANQQVRSTAPASWSCCHAACEWP
jgi:ankyrin repeat protein